MNAYSIAAVDSLRQVMAEEAAEEAEAPATEPTPVADPQVTEEEEADYEAPLEPQDLPVNAIPASNA